MNLLKTEIEKVCKRLEDIEHAVDAGDMGENEYVRLREEQMELELRYIKLAAKIP